METITVQKKEPDRLKNSAEKKNRSDQELKEWKATIEILKNKDLMAQIRESEKNIRLGKTWKSRY
jgi:hypothetical protein